MISTSPLHCIPLLPGQGAERGRSTFQYFRGSGDVIKGSVPSTAEHLKIVLTLFGVPKHD